MKMNRTITVYGASSAQIDEVFIRAGRELGRLAAQRGVAVVDGGGKTGMMGAVNDGALENGGIAIGVIPRFMVERGWGHQGLTRVEVADDMHARKRRMAQLADGVIALPGGVGTFEELLEIITWRKLDLFDGEVVIFNIDGYYDNLLAMLRTAEERHFMNEQLWRVATTAEQALDMALGTDN